MLFRSGVIATVLCVLVPLQMAGQNWDDHDRSGRYMCRDFGANYLESCEPNAVIFTNGWLPGRAWRVVPRFRRRSFRRGTLPER